MAWWNAEQLHSGCGDIPPVDFEAAYQTRLRATQGVDHLTHAS